MNYQDYQKGAEQFRNNGAAFWRQAPVKLSRRTKVQGYATMALVVAAALCALAACQDKHQEYPGGEVVPVPSRTFQADAQMAAREPAYVGRCLDGDTGAEVAQGPCLDEVGDSGMWIYVPAGSKWPIGQHVTLCPTEDGGPTVPCAWLSEAPNDPGAYVYGLVTL